MGANSPSREVGSWNLQDVPDAQSTKQTERVDRVVSGEGAYPDEKRPDVLVSLPPACLME